MANPKAPNYSDDLAKFVTSQTLDVADVSAATATAQSAPVQAHGEDIFLELDVTAASGTAPTLDVVIETSADGSTGWTSVGSFAQATAVGSERKAFTGLNNYVRANYTIGGTTPSFDFTVKAL